MIISLANIIIGWLYIECIVDLFCECLPGGVQHILWRSVRSRSVFYSFFSFLVVHEWKLIRQWSRCGIGTVTRIRLHIIQKFNSNQTNHIFLVSVLSIFGWCNSFSEWKMHRIQSIPLTNCASIRAWNCIDGPVEKSATENRITLFSSNIFDFVFSLVCCSIFVNFVCTIRFCFFFLFVVKGWMVWFFCSFKWINVFFFLIFLYLLLQHLLKTSGCDICIIIICLVVFFFFLV